MQIIKEVGKVKKIKITVVDRLGKKGCHRGMKVGMTFGGETPYKTRFCCSDPDTVIVYSIEIVE